MTSVRPGKPNKRVGKHDRDRAGRKSQRHAGQQDRDEDDDEQDAQKLDAHGDRLSLGHDAQLSNKVGDALQQQQQAGDGYCHLDRPDRRVPRRAGALRLQERAPGHFRADPDQRADINGETDEADHVGHPLGGRAEHPVDQVDAHMPALQQGIAAAQQIGDGRQIDRRLVGPDGCLAEQTARDHLVEDGDRDDDDGCAPEPGDPGVEPVDRRTEARERGRSRSGCLPRARRLPPMSLMQRRPGP